jgi:hypothetical protein
LRAEEGERARLAKLEGLATREPQVWLQVEQLLAKSSASGYNEAVAQLAELGIWHPIAASLQPSQHDCKP